MRGSFVSFLAGVAIAASAAGVWVLVAGAGQSEKPDLLCSAVKSWDDARQIKDKWGEMRVYYSGESFGATNVLGAIAVIQPGESVHPAHRHVEEEFLVIMEGEGLWHLDGKDLPAKKGDVQYLAPWVWHGLVNTGKSPLTFFVARWQGKGVPMPPTPPGDHGR